MDIAFKRRAVLAALAVMSFPLLVRSGAAVAFEQRLLNPRFEQIGAHWGQGELRVFFRSALRWLREASLGGMLLAFARASGEFGATIMVAGNIPGKTATLSLSTYEAVQLGDNSTAFGLLGISVGAKVFVAVGQ